MTSKGTNLSGSRRSNTTPNEKRGDRTGQRKSTAEARAMGRTPGIEEDDEIANYMLEGQASENIARPRDPAPSVAGTEHQSIVEKMDWKQMKDLYDLVSKQKDEASRGTHMVIDASRFSGSDNFSDLSDNTSKDASHPAVQDFHGRVPPSMSGMTNGRKQSGCPQPHHSPGILDGVIGLLGDTEAECINNLVNISDTLSVSALESLVNYLSQVLNVKCRESDTSHLVESTLPNLLSSDEFIFLRDRRSNSNIGTSPDSRQTPQRQTMQESPHMLSQSAPSSFFAGAVPLGLSAASASNQNKRNSPRRISRENSSSVTCVLTKPSKDEMDDEDEEIKSLSSNHEKHHTPGTEKHRRTLSTPSPKPRRYATTPTKTPPTRSGAVPPIPCSAGRDSAESEFGGMNMMSSSSMSMSAKGSVTNNKKRCSESPIVISAVPAATVAVLPVVIRKDSSSSITSAVGDLKITVPAENGHSSGHSKKQKPNYDVLSARVIVEQRLRNGSNNYYPSELHLSPSCAFDDCSVQSGSSASYYSSGNYQ